MLSVVRSAVVRRDSAAARWSIVSRDGSRGALRSLEDRRHGAHCIRVMHPGERVDRPYRLLLMSRQCEAALRSAIPTFRHHQLDRAEEIWRMHFFARLSRWVIGDIVKAEKLGGAMFKNDLQCSQKGSASFIALNNWRQALQWSSIPESDRQTG